MLDHIEGFLIPDSVAVRRTDREGQPQDPAGFSFKVSKKKKSFKAVCVHVCVCGGVGYNLSLFI